MFSIVSVYACSTLAHLHTHTQPIAVRSNVLSPALSHSLFQLHQPTYLDITVQYNEIAADLSVGIMYYETYGKTVWILWITYHIIRSCSDMWCCLLVLVGRMLCMYLLNHHHMCTNSKLAVVVLPSFSVSSAFCFTSHTLFCWSKTLLFISMWIVSLFVPTCMHVMYARFWEYVCAYRLMYYMLGSV